MMDNKKNAAETGTKTQETTPEITPEITKDATSTPGANGIADAKANGTPETPAATATTTTQAPETPETNRTQETPAALDPAYLTNGYHKGEGTRRYMDPDLLDKTAQRLAQELAAGGLKSSGFNPVLRDLKKSNKKTLPLEAKRGALAGAIVMAKQLEQRHRAPHLLVDVLERNRATVKTDADYMAAIKHLTAVGVFLGDYPQK